MNPLRRNRRQRPPGPYEADCHTRGVGACPSPRSSEFDSAKPEEGSDDLGRLQVFVHDLDGTSLSIGVDAHETVYALKEDIFIRTTIPPRSQRLLFEGRQLRDHRALKSYGIRKSSIIQLTMNLRGGFVSAPCLLGCFAGLAFGIPILKFAISPIVKYREEMKERRAEEERRRKKKKKKKKKKKGGKKDKKVAAG